MTMLNMVISSSIAAEEEVEVDKGGGGGAEPLLPLLPLEVGGSSPAPPFQSTQGGEVPPAPCFCACACVFAVSVSRGEEEEEEDEAGWVAWHGVGKLMYSKSSITNSKDCAHHTTAVTPHQLHHTTQHNTTQQGEVRHS